MDNHTLLCNRMGHAGNEILVACMNSDCQNPIPCCIQCMTKDHQTHHFSDMPEIKKQIKQKLALLYQISQLSFQIYQYAEEQNNRIQKKIEEFKENFAISEHVTLTQLTNSAILIRKNSYQQNINILISKYQDLYNSNQKSFSDLLNQTSHELSLSKQLTQTIQIQKPEKSKIQIQEISNKYQFNPQPFQFVESKAQNIIYLEYCEKYKRYLSIVNIIELAIDDAKQKISRFFVVPQTALAAKRIYQIRMVLQGDLELKQNSFKLQHFHGFVTSQNYKDLLKEITQQNEILKKDVESFLQQAVSIICPQDQKQEFNIFGAFFLAITQDYKLRPLLNMDISKDVGDQAFDCLFTKLNAGINELIIKCKSGQDKQNLSLLDYLRLKYKVLLACGVLSLPIYTIDEETFNEQKFNRIDQLNQKAQIEVECKEVELKLEKLRSNK